MLSLALERVSPFSFWVFFTRVVVFFGVVFSAPTAGYKKVAKGTKNSISHGALSLLLSAVKLCNPYG